ncbi:MAG: ATP-binding protein, partial [Chloroflexota bacterium]|nr:ATP-binding protein [Chloroflexota bacterium]
MSAPILSPPTLVGRESEFTVLRARLAAATDGHGSLVLIGGEAGVGKTALAEALCAEAQQHGALVLVGRCYDLSETPPFGPWTEARCQFPPSSEGPPGSIP